VGRRLKVSGIVDYPPAECTPEIQAVFGIESTLITTAGVLRPDVRITEGIQQLGRREAEKDLLAC